MEISFGKVEAPQRVVIYGVEGIGKTTLASKFPEPLFIDVEGGTGHLDVARTARVVSWDELIADVTEAAAAGYKTVVVDTVDAAEQLCVEHVCAANDKAGIEEFGYGKGYTYVAEEFGKLLDRLNRLVEMGMNVVAIAHAQVKKFEQPDEACAYDRWELKLQKKTAPLVKEWCDALLFLNYSPIVEVVGKDKAKARGSERVMHVTHDACWDAKNRWGLEGRLPMEYEPIAAHIPGSAGAASTDRAKAQKLERRFTKAVANAVELVTPEHLTHLKGMLEGSGYTLDDLRAAVSSKGFYPADEDVSNYSDEFVVETCLGQFEELCALMRRMSPQRDEEEVPF